MSIAPGYTDEEIRSIVFEYERLRYGTKYAWVEKQAFSMHQLRRWRNAVYDGDLDRGLIPREAGSMTSPNQRRRIAKNDVQEEADNEQLRARIRELEATNEALGKAIGLLHQLSDQEPDTDPTSEPKSS
ncbi:hypothetical protein CEY15_05955 [Dietzia natronolimnaea]|uniref:Transposase n=1 Tax=Dietzia natronolimnaea TaxID=161920 RepID=A0A2A2WRZ3_9ACTN|nr:hypothetical protein [Dietzia natronolimnaea]PAY23925.1 hypothetical protein CEY15_05955 [Dietzia natronolimnaea]